MAQAIATKLARGKLEKMVDEKKASYDPYFKTVTKANGKKKRIRKDDSDIPLGISERDAEILLKVRRRAYRLDNAMTFPITHTKFGVTAIIGLIPGLGDFADVILGAWVYSTCRKVGLDPKTESKMIFNIALDGAIGLIPVLGDVADTFFRCNTRNLKELERFLEKKGEESFAGVKGKHPEKKSERRKHAANSEREPSIPPRYEDAVGEQGRRTRNASPAPQRARTNGSGRDHAAASGRHQDNASQEQGTKRTSPSKPPRRDGSFF